MLAFDRLVIHQQIAEEEGAGFKQIRCSIVVSISACHAEGPGSIPGRGVFLADPNLLPKIAAYT